MLPTFSVTNPWHFQTSLKIFQFKRSQKVSKRTWINLKEPELVTLSNIWRRIQVLSNLIPDLMTWIWYHPTFLNRKKDVFSLGVAKIQFATPCILPLSSAHGIAISIRQMMMDQKRDFFEEKILSLQFWY